MKFTLGFGMAAAVVLGLGMSGNAAYCQEYRPMGALNVNVVQKVSLSAGIERHAKHEKSGTEDTVNVPFAQIEAGLAGAQFAVGMDRHGFWDMESGKGSLMHKSIKAAVFLPYSSNSGYKDLKSGTTYVGVAGAYGFGIAAVTAGAYKRVAGGSSGPNVMANAGVSIGVGAR